MANSIINLFWLFFQVVIGFNLVFPLILYVINSIRPKFQLEKPEYHKSYDYAVIVTAYEQTHTLKAVVNSLLKLNYEKFLIYIVADKCDITNLSFDSQKVVLLRPEETLASNTRSHFYAINHFVRPHHILTIIDSDNIVHPNYLNELNKYFNAGFEAVQGIREAKNLDTTLACLDAARDIYYHYYDGKLLFNAGSSATLAGSGMAFTTSLYKDCLEKLDVQGAGFDKVLQAQIIKRKKRIAFAPLAIVYDEKTSKSDQLVNQRSRWINTWFKYFSYGFGLILEGVKNLSWNQFLFGIVLLRPPLFIFLFLSGFALLINLPINPIVSGYWLLGFVSFVAGFAISIASSKADKKIVQSLTNIPKFMFFQVISLVNARRANKRSVATQHYHAAKIEEIV